MKVYTKTTTTYYISKCHHCGGELSRKTYSQIGFGNALVRCPHCGQYTIDSNIKEMAMQPWQYYLDNQQLKENKIVKYLVYGWLPALYIILGISGALKSSENFSAVRMVILVLLYAIGIGVYNAKMSKGFNIDSYFEKQYKESEKRLADPQYRQLYTAIHR